MTGQQHRVGTIATSTLVATIMWKFMLFSWLIFFIVPYSWITADSPDIDQKDTAPKRWKQIRKLLFTMVGLTLTVSLGYLVYALACFINDLQFDMTNVIISAGIVLSFVLIYLYIKTDSSKFFTKHRGFTHTLVIPILLGLLVRQLYLVLNKDLRLECYMIIILLNVMLGLIISKDIIGVTKSIKKILHYCAYAVIVTIVILLVYYAISFNELKDIVINVIWYIILGFEVGIISHIFEDMLCKAGCPILFPFTKKSIHIGTAVTSDVTSWLWTIGLIAVCTVGIVFIISL